MSRRLEIVSELQILELNDDVRFLAQHYEKELGLSDRAKADIPHFAFAVSYKMDYLVTWNCNHIANGEIIRHKYLDWLKEFEDKDQDRLVSHKTLQTNKHQETTI